MASPSIRPHMLVADEQGNIYDHPDFLLLCRRGEEWSLPLSLIHISEPTRRS